MNIFKNKYIYFFLFLFGCEEVQEQQSIIPPSTQQQSATDPSKPTLNEKQSKPPVSKETEKPQEGTEEQRVHTEDRAQVSSWVMKSRLMALSLLHSVGSRLVTNQVYSGLGFIFPVTKPLLGTSSSAGPANHWLPESNPYQTALTWGPTVTITGLLIGGTWYLYHALPSKSSQTAGPTKLHSPRLHNDVHHEPKTGAHSEKAHKDLYEIARNMLNDLLISSHFSKNEDTLREVNPAFENFLHAFQEEQDRHEKKNLTLAYLISQYPNLNQNVHPLAEDFCEKLIDLFEGTLHL
jgi:hypothetical protein